jgi:putative phosphoesterase
MPVSAPQNHHRGTVSNIIRVGVVSDTHGYLHPSIASVFKGVQRIVHTGDIESPAILTALARIAPVNPVRGNMDFGKWAAALPREDVMTVGTITICALHDLTRLSMDTDAAGIDVVLSGHTHRPKASWQGGCLFLNPGSASLPRHGQAPSVAILEINGAHVNHRFYELDVLA